MLRNLLTTPNAMRNTFYFALACTVAPLHAATITMTDSTMSSIPDGSSAGLARTLSVTGSGELISSVEVDVTVSSSAGSAFLGDLYIYLTNGSQLAVLANRPGRRSGAPGGYGDNQTATVTFSETGTNDFHLYRLPLTGSNTTPITAPLTGIWLPDARATDPASVLDTDARTASLNVFNGLPADGTWSLFAADLSTGATHQVNTWTLRIQTVPVPEPGAWLLALGAGGAWLARRRRV
jgi:subtilisin-like proprotein convertase family protein